MHVAAGVAGELRRVRRAITDVERRREGDRIAGHRGHFFDLIDGPAAAAEPVERAGKRIGSSLQAHAKLYLESEQDLDGVDLAEICITSSLSRESGDAPTDAFKLPDVAGIAALIEPASGEKCQRCWKVLPEVGDDAAHPDLCLRCADAVEHLPSHTAAGG